MKKLFFCLLFVFMNISVASADMFTPSPSCYRPSKPYQFNSQYEIDQFMDEVETYKQCINDFVEEQGDAVQNHRNAADEAIDEWNSFVNYELN
jgi:hypothetical protein